MESRALYFPYIRVPEAGWFTRTLLYWDGVRTIVPQSLAASDSVIGGTRRSSCAPSSCVRSGRSSTTGP
jgi:hypothetical protein